MNDVEERLRAHYSSRMADVGADLPAAAAVKALAPPARRRGRAAGDRWSTSARLVAAACVAAAAVTGTQLLGGAPTAGADAAAFLTSAARTSAAQEGSWRDAPYWYSRWSQSQGPLKITGESWAGNARPGRAVTTEAGRRTTKATEPATFIVGGGRTTDWDGLWQLPTDPDALEEHLREAREGVGPDADTELFAAVGDLLRRSPASPALRAALYEVAARVPGVRLGGTVTDAAGRSGTAVERTDPDGGVKRYVIDPSDGQLLQEQDDVSCSPEVLANPGAEADNVAANCADVLITTLEQGPVTAIGARPGT